MTLGPASPRSLCEHGLQNYSQRGIIGLPVDPDFVRLIEVLGRVQQAGGPGMRVMRDQEGSRAVLFFPPNLTAASAADVAEVFSFLMFLFTLTESGSGQVSPVLTVPAG